MRIVLLWLTVTGAAVAAPQSGDPGTPEHAKAADLVKKLGHPRFPVREAAAKDLLDMGGAAAAALREGLKSGDEEVRARSATLLPKAIALDWQRKADAFLADTAGKQSHSLPLLAEFEKAVGGTLKDPPVRALFAEMIRANGDFLARLMADPKAAPTTVEDQIIALVGQSRVGDKQVSAPTADLAAILFADLQIRGRHPTDAGGIAVLVANPGLPAALVRDTTGPAMRRLVGAWATGRWDKDLSHELQSLNAFLDVVSANPFPEAVPALAAIARSDRINALMGRVAAVRALAKIDSKESRATVNDLVGDKTVLFSHQGIEYRLGDSALSAAVTQNGLKPKDFGLADPLSISFALAAPGGNNNFRVVQATMDGFATDAARKAGIQRWKDAAKKK